MGVVTCRQWTICEVAQGTLQTPPGCPTILSVQTNEPMNLYILNGVLNDYTSGMCVIAAESKIDCEQIFMEEFAPSEFRKKELQNEFNEAEIKVIENVDYPAGLVSYVYGGG